DPENEKEVVCELRGTDNRKFANGEIITGEKINSYNDFGEKEEVSIQSFKDVKIDGNTVKIKMPAKSIVMVELE
ncbi:MAG: alpha-L-arabinofuranosidase C-terminal domain-containing protein, partial [Draconibacterium sp.]|nr:alpha-L-arabinofuranosidase C-terminal domain-containing protein [Draconibacterium sp.]